LGRSSLLWPSLSLAWRLALPLRSTFRRDSRDRLPCGSHWPAGSMREGHLHP
jgi:hypothetical protein